MSAAQIAAMLVHAYCRQTWPEPLRHQKDSAQMASTVLCGGFLDVFDFKSFGTHKYIPKDKLNADLGEPEGAGVFGYLRMHDDSYVLQTCDGRLATWSGKDEDKAEWTK